MRLLYFPLMSLLKKELGIVVGIFLLALGVRLLYLYESSANPSFETPIVDSAMYNNMARAVASGKPMSDDFFWQPFFYPVFLSVIYSVSNSSITCAKIIQVLLGSIICSLTYLLGKRIFSRGAGIIAAIMTTFYGPLIFLEGELVVNSLETLWYVVLILLILKTSSNKSIWFCTILGICGGLSTITRPTFLPFLITAAIWLAIVLYRARLRWSQITVRLGGILCGFLLIIIPVSAQNLRITGHFGFLPASGGINLFVGNNPNLTKTLSARPGWEWEEITTLPQQNGVVGDMWEQQKYFNKRVISFILTEPLAFAKGLSNKTIQFLNSRELPRNVDIYLFRKWSGILWLLTWKIDGFGFPFGLVLPLTLLGLVSYWRQTPVVMKLFFLTSSLSVIAVFVASRYRTSMIPVMSIMAAAGLLSLIKMIRTIQFSRIAITAICGAGVILLSTITGPFPQEQASFEAELYENVASEEATRGKADEAIEHLNKALLLRPDCPSAHANMGVVLFQKGKVEEAIIHYKKALEFKSDSAEVLNNLAMALAEGKGEVNEAFINLNKALEIRPWYAEAHFNMGNLLLGQNKFDAAVEHYNKAIQSKPDYSKAHGNLAVALISLGKIEEAITHFREAVRLQPEDSHLRYNLATALVNQGRTEEAIKEFREILRLNPEDVDALDYLAWILATEDNPTIRNPQEAILLAEKACELGGNKQPELLSTLAGAYAADGRFDDAVGTIDKALQLAESLGREKLTKQLQEQLKNYKNRNTTEERRPLPTETDVNQ
ncbi:MAG: tetratricopeptide repeat protein [Sedimentisphaerales bacterium]|nr:tetratricopeptide repeat protein [Sedimentisphaerales bacterium]